MAKSNLLKEAIADAKAVKETALANAKLALQEAFQPRVEAMLSAKLQEELEDEEDVDLAAAGDGADVVGDEMSDEAGMGAGMGATPDSVNVGLDFNDDGEYDLTGIVGGADELEAGADELEAGADDIDAAVAPAEEDDLNLEEILRELEMGAEASEEAPIEPADELTAEVYEGEGYDDDEKDISEIIEAILRETEEDAAALDAPAESDVAELQAENEEMEKELQEAYKTVKYLKNVINEVNLLNAKLLYTNKLFRNFELSENQKMKVIENFDRAASTREAKLVFATLAESFKRPSTTRRAIKESKMANKPNASASRPAISTAPSKQTTQILSEGFEMANRWKELAGLI
jgi:hypothetical protein